MESAEPRKAASPVGYRFDEFELTTRPLALRRRGELVSLPLQPLRLLALLLQRSGALVPHEEIRTHLWPERVVDYARSVHVHVRTLRVALGDDAGAPRFIETVPRQGYRCVARVEVIDRVSWRGRPWGRLRNVAAVGFGLALVTFRGFGSTDTAPEPTAISDAAQDFYKRGRFLLERADRDSIVKSLGYFRKALKAEPSFVDAHVAIARTYGRMGRVDEARHHARRALVLDSHNTQAHAILGGLALWHDWAWDEAHRRFETALADDAENAGAHQGLAAVYALQGSFEPALAHVRKAIVINPASTLIRADAGWYHYFAGDYAAAASTCEEAMHLAPDETSLRHCLVRAFALLGDTAGSREQIEWYMRSNEATEAEIRDVLRRSPTRLLSAFDGWRLRALETKPNPSGPCSAERAYAAAGAEERDRALHYAEAAIDNREPMIPFMVVDPVFDDLRDEPRFQALVRRLGLRARPSRPRRVE